MHALAQLIDGHAAGIRGRAEEPRFLRIDPWICLCPSHVVNSYRSRCKCSIALWCVVLGYNTVCAIIIMIRGWERAAWLATCALARTRRSV